ncbi:MAG: hypothetical protein J2P57_23555 [Acidimicrobiaceae bacterium]|nr:hypothetical protein [Acidimicrobiaceae bacterium]
MTDPSVSLRRVGLAIANLPMGVWPDGEHAASWSTTDYLLANLIDEVRMLTWVTASANSKRRIDRPEPHWRPGGRRRSRPSRQKGGWVDFAKSLAGVSDG